MKPEESFHEIGELLRSDAPRPMASPGLEMRILRALDEAHKPANNHRWRWLILPPAFAGLTLLLWHPTTKPGVVISTPPVPVDAPAMPRQVADVLASDPLHTETLALANDARRAGDFLVNCLPSLDLKP